MESVVKLAKDSGLTVEFLEKATAEAGPVASWLGITGLQAVLFSIISNLNFRSGTVDLDDLSRFLDASPITILKYTGEFEVLCDRRLMYRVIDEGHGKRRKKESATDRKFTVNQAVLDSIMNNEKFVPPDKEDLDLFEFLEAARKIFDDREEGTLCYDDMVVAVKDLLTVNREKEYARALVGMSLEDESLLILILLCCQYTEGNEDPDLVEVMKFLFPGLKTQLYIRKQFLRGCHELITKELVAFDDRIFRSDRNIRLTERSLEQILAEDNALLNQAESKKQPGIILAKEIIPRELFFNPEEEQKLRLLTDTLMPANYDQLVSRMEEAGMKQGMTILFYGAPGTGKTESVCQLARLTGRDIKRVDISETKSMWFGESEKLIKKVFDSYRRVMETATIAPILLFNEADGIFGTRRQLGHSPVDQTENTIQNIILQEMEDMKGILIATTNLEGNLDSAFERRFLYKIRFEKPTPEARIMIWKDKMPFLDNSAIRVLAWKYDLSGGQIDNIARKYMLKNILYDAAPELAELEEYCREENVLQSKWNPVGFRK